MSKKKNHYFFGLGCIVFPVDDWLLVVFEEGGGRLKQKNKKMHGYILLNTSENGRYHY